MSAWAITVLGVLAATPGELPAPSPPASLKLAAVGFTPSGLTEERAAYFSEHFAVKLAGDPAFSVVTRKDLTTILGLERQRALLGCAETAGSCMAELAGALGADGVVTGQLAQVGNSFQLSVKVLAPDGSKALFVYASELLSSEESLLREVSKVAELAAVRLKRHFGRLDATSAEGVSVTRPLGRLVPSVLGAVALGVGAGLAADAGNRYGELTKALDEGRPAADFPQQVAAARSQQYLGLGVGAAGLAAGVAGVLWYFLGPTSPTVAVSVHSTGVGLGATWVLP